MIVKVGICVYFCDLNDIDFIKWKLNDFFYLFEFCYLKYCFYFVEFLIVICFFNGMIDVENFSVWIELFCGGEKINFYNKIFFFYVVNFCEEIVILR